MYYGFHPQLVSIRAGGTEAADTERRSSQASYEDGAILRDRVGGTGGGRSARYEHEAAAKLIED